MRTFFLDFAYAIRTLGARPGLISVVVMTLAIGIGATTSVFSIINAVILKPLPFRQPNRLVHIWEADRWERYQPGEDAAFIFVRPGSFYDWEKQSSSFETMSAYAWRKMILTRNEGAEILWGQEVLGHFFETLGVSARLGRTFDVSDHRPDALRAVILSDHLWTDQFARDPKIVGRLISLDHERYEIVGVMPPGFYPARFYRPDLWIPHWPDENEKEDRVSWRLTTFARLKAGTTVTQAQNEMDVVLARMASDHPRAYQDKGAVLVPVDAQLIGSTWKIFLLLAHGVVVLLAIACVNIGNLLLARAVEREKEFSLRMALGATPWRLLLQLFIENLLLAATSGVLGIGFAAVGTHAMIRLLPESAALPRLESVTIDFAALAFVSGITLLASLSFSLLPLFRLSQNQPFEALKLEGRGFSLSRSKRRMGRLFIISEFALSLMLLIVGALLLQSFLKLERVDPGFERSNLLTLQIEVPQFRYGTYELNGKNGMRELLYEQIERRLISLPGVDSVALTQKLPMKHEPNPWSISVEANDPPSPNWNRGETPVVVAPGFVKRGESSIQRVNPAFFSTLGLKLVRGRFTDERDNSSAPLVAIVNETFAQKFFPNENPIGKHVIVDYTSWFPKVTIIGVVADFKLNALDRKSMAEMFWSLRQAPSETVCVIVRTRANPTTVSASLRHEIQSLDPDIPVLGIESMSEVIADSLWRTRALALLMGLLAGLSIVLALTGIYSVMSYSVSQRIKELGIRIVLGADRANVFALIMGEALRLVLAGTVVGCAAAWAIGRLATAQLYQVNGNDPATFVVTSFCLIAVSLMANYLPARRALGVDPIVALR